MASKAAVKSPPPQPPRGRTGVVLGPPSASSLIEALAWARTHPEEVAAELQQRLQHYRGLEYFPPDRGGRCVVTKEGGSVVEEAIQFVKSQPQLQAMGGPEQGLSLAAEDHVADIGVAGIVSHESSDGTQAADRVKRYGTFASFGECLWYGTEHSDARSMILDLIVDDGVPSRGHRKGVLSPVYTTVGAFAGPHSTFGRMAALEFAKGWQGNPTFIRSREANGPVRMSSKVMAKAKASSSTQWALGKCQVCHQQIQGGRVVDEPQLGGKMHADCFKCQACAAPLAGGAFKVQGQQPYCTACHAEKFATRCKVCEKPITGSALKNSSGAYHPQCAAEAGMLQSQASASAPANPKGAAGKAAFQAAGKPALSAAGSHILGGDMAGQAKAAPKAKAKAKAKPLLAASMRQARSTTAGVGMDYMGLD
mmetsp:Transcript_42249/g.95044  ORF Transcript_42249/g.95044 Transcript_42249/m.95044 type:complete len:423 (+) Transcript_42249:30-1298(+)